MNAYENCPYVKQIAFLSAEESVDKFKNLEDKY
jgi:hypothetical protein